MEYRRLLSQESNSEDDDETATLPSESESNTNLSSHGITFDDLLVEIGEFGPYQRRVFVLASLVVVAAAYQFMSAVFLLDIPDHRCAIPGYENDTFVPQSSYHQHLINLTSPLVVNAQGEATHSKCNLYNVTTGNPGDNFTQYECDSWVYDTSVMENTVISQFNMVCSSKIFRSFCNMMTFLGGTCGTVLCGIIADACGRKNAMIPMIALNVVCSVMSALAPSYEIYIVTTFFYGLTAAGLYLIPFVIALEIVGPSKRTFSGMVINFFWVAGLFLLTAAAYLIRNWRILRLVLGIPNLIFISYWWSIPESPRWLISRGKYKEALLVIRRIAVANSVDINDGTLDKLTTVKRGDTTRLRHMFTTPQLLLRALIIFFNMFTVNLVYLGLTLNVSNLSGDIYLNFFLSSLVELVAYAGALLLMYRVGRKPLHIAVMLVSGTACLASVLPVLYGSASITPILTGLSLVAKLGLSASFAIILLYIAELFPTVVRETGLATTTVFGNIGAMIAPYFADLGILVEGKLAEALPLVVFGCVTLVAGLLVFLLPETRHRKLPETITDAINFGKINDSESYVVDAPKSLREPKKK